MDPLSVLGGAVTAGSSLFGAKSAPVLSGLGSLMSSMGAYDASMEAEDRAYERTKSLMKLQNDYNVRMWNMANEYNSPSHQMQLLKDAGINPLMYDFASGGGQASEVTSAPGTAPYNTRQQDIDPSERIIRQLSTDATIQKLRTDITYQKMLNEDYSLRLAAARKGLPMPLVDEADDYEVDEFGNPIVTVRSPRLYNKYEEERALSRLGIGDAAIMQQLHADEAEVYRDTKDLLKKMPAEQLANLRQDIRSKILDNSLKAEDVKMMQQYGISSRDSNEWVTLIKASLRNPSAVYNIIDALLNAAAISGGSLIERGIRAFKGSGVSHRNASW